MVTSKISTYDNYYKCIIYNSIYYSIFLRYILIRIYKYTIFIYYGYLYCVCNPLKYFDIKFTQFNSFHLITFCERVVVYYKLQSGKIPVVIKYRKEIKFTFPNCLQNKCLEMINIF